MLRRKDDHQGHHYKLDVGDGHAHLLCLLLGILQHVDILGDAIRLHVVVMHVRPEGDHVRSVEYPAVGIQEGDDVQGRPLCVESVDVFDVVLPDLLHRIVEKLGSAVFGHLITGVVIKAGFVG